MDTAEEPRPKKRLSIKEWKEDDRPREKLMKLGPEALSKAELLAILIGSGTKDESAVALTTRILDDNNGSLRRVGRLGIERLCQYKGIGQAKAITILAACQMGRMREYEEDARIDRVQNSADIDRYFRQIRNMGERNEEEARVLLLNNSLRILGDRKVGQGGITGTVVDVRLILREALLAGATAIALCHNHPSGSIKPSIQDNDITAKLQKASAAMDIKLIDHIIISERGYFSYADEGRL